MLINNDTYQRETLPERPIRQPLTSTKFLSHKHMLCHILFQKVHTQMCRLQNSTGGLERCSQKNVIDRKKKKNGIIIIIEINPENKKWVLECWFWPINIAKTWTSISGLPSGPQLFRALQQALKQCFSENFFFFISWFMLPDKKNKNYALQLLKGHWKIFEIFSLTEFVFFFFFKWLIIYKCTNYTRSSS